MKNLWDHPVSTVTDGHLDMTVRIKWLASRPHLNAVTFERTFMTKKGVLPMADVAASCVEAPIISGATPGLIYVSSDTALISIYKDENRPRSSALDDYFDDFTSPNPDLDFQKPSDMVRTMKVGVSITAPRELVTVIFNKLEVAFKKERQAEIRWWFKGERGSVSYKNIYLPPLTTKLHKEFYPDLDTDPSKFLKDYIASEASVMLLAGPPGTGKTTLLRHLIGDFNLTAHVLFDEELMNTDKVFQAFLFEDESDIMIIEDADTLLQGREDHNNKMMQRFLSVSDGLIKLPNKKLVFTTNITDFSRVDAALIRPGRCFSRTHTRALTYTEAVAAATAAKLPMPEKRHEYTLAELFNSMATPEVRKIGFV